MTKTIYLITGTTGDYEDTYEWNVKGFENKDKADLLLKKLNDLAQKGHVGNYGSNYSERSSRMGEILKAQEKVAKQLRKLDPKASVSGSGTNYSIETLEIETED